MADFFVQSVEGARIQLENAQTDAIVVSTLPEAYAMINSDLTSSGLLKQVWIFVDKQLVQ